MKKVNTSSYGVWPKPPLELSPEEEALKEQVILEFQQWGYTGLLGWVQAQGHTTAEQLSRAGAKYSGVVRSLEIGCGSGYHFQHTGPGEHYGLDHSLAHLHRAQSKFPDYRILQGDVYNLPFAGSTFDRVVSIYLFEHLNRLPECLAEVKRVLKSGGELLVALPSEGGIAYEWGRYLTSKRHFERKYKTDYLRLVRSEHCNSCKEVIDELHKSFRVESIRYLPFRISTVHLNAIVALRCVNQTQESTR